MNINKIMTILLTVASVISCVATAIDYKHMAAFCFVFALTCVFYAAWCAQTAIIEAINKRGNL